MQFNPGVNDISGQILGQGVAGAAKTRADMMSQMGQDIGGAIEDIGGALTNSLEFNNMGDSAFEGIKAISEMYPGMKKIATSLENLPDRERRMASLFTAQNFGALSQFAVAGMRDSTMQAGQQLDRDRPFIDASLENLGNTAAGRSTYGTPRGETTVEPALPVGGDFLSPVRYGAGMQNNVTRFAPSQKSVSTARNWSAGYFGKQNP